MIRAVCKLCGDMLEKRFGFVQKPVPVQLPPEGAFVHPPGSCPSSDYVVGSLGCTYREKEDA